MISDTLPLSPPPHDATMSGITEWAIRRALHLENGIKPAAAMRLGISLKTLYNWLTRMEFAGRPYVGESTDGTNEVDDGQHR